MRKSVFAMMLLLSSAVFASEPKTYGEVLPEAVAVPISVAAADADAYAGKANRFSGRITEVCQKQGCWVVLEHDGHSARVMAKDHGFAVPKDASGDAIVHGVLHAEPISPDHARHLVEDDGASAPADSELRITATSIRVL